MTDSKEKKFQTINNSKKILKLLKVMYCFLQDWVKSLRNDSQNAFLSQKDQPVYMTFSPRTTLLGYCVLND